MSSRFIAVAALAALSVFATNTSLDAKEIHVRVEAGESDRVETPVGAMIDRDGWSEPKAYVVSEGKKRAAQVEIVDEKHAKIWFVVDRLAAGATREYKIVVGELAAGGRAAAGGKDSTFSWKASSGDHGTSNDLVLGDRPVLRYMHTKFDKTDIENTKKPFHMVYSPDGKQFITKGVGGLFPHHRGIYFGYNKCKVDGKSYDIWHAARGEHSVHVEELERFEGPVFGGHEVRIHWNDREGKTFISEVRRLLVFRQSSGHHLIHFSSTLTPTRGPVDLDGDPQHAGVQFRSAQYVAENQKKTRYLRPGKWKDLPEDKQINWPGNKQHANMPWNAIRIHVNDGQYTVAYLSHPANSDDRRSSERLYGRFGEYFPFKLRKDNLLRVNYRRWIASSHDPKREDVEKRYQDLAAPPKATLFAK